MKGQISRQSHAPAKGYSGVFHIQGGMITDADLNEGTRIARDRVEALGNDAIRDGVPAEGGVVGNLHFEKPDEPFLPFLKPGLVYADGIRGVVRAEGEIKDFMDKPLALLNVQEDLREVFELDQSDELILYADLWHRTVAPIEDPRLLEVALHGAETALREKTMTQLKVAPIDALEDITKATGRFQPTGNGVLTVAPFSDIETGNDCDPCAREIELEDRVPNALFRIEIIEVETDGGEVESVTLAWSSENAAEIARADAQPKPFTDGTHAYEHTSRRIEEMKGVFAYDAKVDYPKFESSVQTFSGRPLVRRWDGAAKINLGNAPEVEQKWPDDAPVGIRAGHVEINGPGFQAKLHLRGKLVIAGDYWLVELRSNARNTQDRFKEVSHTPIGIRHSYCPLLRIKDGEVAPLSDAEERFLSFPSLSNLPATHIGYAHDCPDLYGDAENVQEALDNLCGLDAGQIKLRHNCDKLYGDADTVEAALENLCDYDFGKNADRTWMRYICDWGVVCGLKIKRLDELTLHITDGAWLDWAGQFETVTWEKIGVYDGKIPIEDIHLDIDSNGGDGAFTIGLGWISGELRLIVAEASKFELPGDLTMEEKQRQCENSGKFNPKFDAVLETMNAKERKVLHHVIGLAASGAWQSSDAALDDGEYQMTMHYVEALAQTETNENAALIEAQLDRIKSEYSLAGLRGEALSKQRARQAGGMLSALFGLSEEAIRACKCYALWPDCVDRSKAPPLTPLGQVKIKHEGGKILALYHVCMLRERRQAMTPRAVSYYMREVVEQIMETSMFGHKPVGSSLERLAEICCPGDDPKTDGNRGGRLGWVDDLVLKYPDGYQPDRYTLNLDGLTKEQALEKLIDAGVLIDDQIDFLDADAVEKVAEIIGSGSIEERLVQKEAIGPGDHVLLMSNDGIAKGYLVIARGQGLSPYSVAAAAKAPAGRPAPGGGGGATQYVPDTGALEETFKDYEGRLDALRSGLEALYADGGTLKQLEEGQAALAESAGQLDDLEARQAALETNLQAKFDELLDSGLADHEAEMTTLLEGMASRFGTLNTTQKELEGALDAAGLRLGDLGPRVGGLADILDRAEAFDPEAFNSKLQAALERAETAQSLVSGVEEAVKDAQGLEATLAEHKLSQVDLGDRLSDTQDALTSITSQSNDLSTEIYGALNEHKAFRDDLIETINQHITTSSGDLGRLEDRHASLGRLITSSETAIGRLETGREAKVAETAEILEGLTQSIQLKQGELNDLGDQVDGAIDAANSRLGDLGTRVDGLADILDRAEGFDAVAFESKLQTTLQQAERAQSLVGGVEEAMKDAQDLGETLAEYRTVRDELRDSLPGLQNSYNWLKNRSSEFSTEIFDALNEHKAFRDALIETIDQRVTTSSADLTRFENRHSELARLISLSETAIGQLESSREATVAETADVLDGLTRSIQLKQNELNTLKDQVEGAQDALNTLSKESDALIQAMRRERPVTAIPNVVQLKWTEPMHQQGLFSIGDVLNLNAQALRRLEEADKDLHHALVDWIRETAADYVSG